MADLAFIPARGGSKRLPRKNILKINGRPMIAWTILAAQQSESFDDIVVSTEDPEIARISKEFGATVDQRPVHLASDQATVDEVCLEFIQRPENIESYENVCCLYPTTPLRSKHDIMQVMEKLKRGECKQIMSVSTFDLYAHQAMFFDTQGNLSALRPDLLGCRYDEMPLVVGDNGSIYASTISALIDEVTLVGSSIKGYFMEKERSIDVDSEEEFELLQVRMKRIMG